MVSSIIKLIGHNSQLFWGVFNRKPSSALVRTETPFTPCWSQCGVALLLASTVLSENTSQGNTKSRRASKCRVFCGAAGCSPKPRALPFSFFLFCLLGRVVEEQFLYPGLARTVVQQNQTRQGEIFTLFPAASLKNAQTFPVETLVIQVHNPAVSTGQITVWSWLILVVMTPKHLGPDQRASRIWQTWLVWAIKR